MASSPDEVPKLTVDKKILLHLFEMEHDEEDFEVPQEVVQDGIAVAVSIRRDNIPRTMKKLKQEGLVKDVLKRIKGLPRKRKAYFLTDEGLDYAKQVRDDVAYHNVYLQLADGSVKQVNLKDVPSYLNMKISLLELYGVLESENLLKETDIREKMTVDEERPRKLDPDGFVSFLQDVPMPKRFFGRERELGLIDDWVSEEGSSVLSITGIAGIGKTTLAAKAAKDREGSMHVFWYRFHKWDSLRNLLYSIARFLDRMGRSGLKAYLDDTSKIDGRDMYPILTTSLDGAPIFMVFDDFQRAADDIVEFFSNMKELLKDVERLKIMIVGRQVFPFYDRSDVLIKGVVKELNLGGLDKNSCKGLMKIRDVDQELFERIYEITKGHPLFLQLVLSARDLRDQKDIKRYIYEEIFKKLDEKDSLLLQIASVYRYPVPSEAFFMEKGLSFETLDHLVETNLIQETSYDEYEAHDLIKEFFYNRLTPSQKLEYHRRAANYYMEVGTMRATVEAMYHMALSGDSIKALKLASTYGESIITGGYVEQFASVLSLLEKEKVDPEFFATARLLKGEVEMIMGRWDKAMTELKRAAAIAEAENREIISARANLKLGSLESRRGNKDTALKRLQKALKIARKMEDKEEMAKALQGLGDLYSTKGEFRDAKKCLREARDLSEELGDPTLKAASYTGLGIIYTNQDKPDRSIEEFRKAIETLEKGENTLEMARVKISLGTVLSVTGDYERAKENFEDAVELSSGAGDIRQQGYALAGGAHVYLRDGDLETAGEYLDEALSIFTRLGEKYKISMIHLDYGRLHLMRDNIEQAKGHLDKCLKILKDLNLPYYQERTAKQVVDMLEKKGRLKEANSYRKKYKVK